MTVRELKKVFKDCCFGVYTSNDWSFFEDNEEEKEEFEKYLDSQVKECTVFEDHETWQNYVCCEV